MRVSFLGVRGSTPAPGEEFLRYGGHTSCLAIAHDGEAPTLVLDAGTGIRRVGALLDEQSFKGSIVLSHLHWDHIHGLPFFVHADRNDARVSLFIPDQGDGSDPLEVLARGMSPPHFPVRPDELRGDWTFTSLVTGKLEIEGFSILVEEIPHKGGRTFGVRVSDDHSTLTYMPDHCPDAEGPGPDGLGEYHAAALELCKDSNLLVHDAQLVVEELKAEGYFGHAAAEYAVELARRANVPHVVLFHHKPHRTDDELDAIGRRFGDTPRVTIATQSTVLDL
ncbi:MAG: MBL fold metallo-hydrolase [Acidimicrobiales bacterium]